MLIFSSIDACFCVNTQALLFWQSFMHFPNEIASIVSRHKTYPSFRIFIFCVYDFFFLFISLTFIKLEMLNTYYTHSIIIMTLTMIDEFKMNVHSMLDSHFFFDGVLLPFFFFLFNFACSFVSCFTSISDYQYLWQLYFLAKFKQLNKSGEIFWWDQLDFFLLLTFYFCHRLDSRLCYIF